MPETASCRTRLVALCPALELRRTFHVASLERAVVAGVAVGDGPLRRRFRERGEDRIAGNPGPIAGDGVGSPYRHPQKTRERKLLDESAGRKHRVVRSQGKSPLVVDAHGHALALKTVKLAADPTSSEGFPGRHAPQE
jgi:hypothetical protein